jgi:hypothetical protein
MFHYWLFDLTDCTRAVSLTLTECSNYTVSCAATLCMRATTACRQSWCQLLRIGVAWLAQWIPMPVLLDL